MKVLVVLLPADGRVPFVTCDAWPITADFRTPLAASHQRTRGAMVYISDPTAVVSAAPKVSLQNKGFQISSRGMAHDAPPRGPLASVPMHKVVGLAWDPWDPLGPYGTF